MLSAWISMKSPRSVMAVLESGTWRLSPFFLRSRWIVFFRRLTWSMSSASRKTFFHWVAAQAHPGSVLRHQAQGAGHAPYRTSAACQPRSRSCGPPPDTSKTTLEQAQRILRHDARVLAHHPVKTARHDDDGSLMGKAPVYASLFAPRLRPNRNSSGRYRRPPITGVAYRVA